MAETAELQIVINAQDLASAKLKEVQAQSETMSKSFEKAGSSITSAGHTLLPFSAAAGVGLGLAVHAAENFNQQMLLIQTQAGGSAKEVANLTGAVLKLAPAVGQTPQELAKALFFVESAGFRGSQAMDILKLSAEGAAVGQADLTETTRVLTSLMNDHVQGAENATRAMGNLNAIVGAGKLTFNDLNAAMATGIGATAGAFGVSIQSVGAALADLTNKGVPAVDAATHLRMMMLTMELPTTSAAKALSALGLTTTDASNRTAAMTEILKKSGVTQSQLADDLKKPNGISVALTDLRDRLIKAGASSSEASAMIEKSLGGVRAGNTAVILANDLGGLNDRFAQIGRTAGDFNNSWAAQQEQAKQKMESFKASVSVLEIELGNAFLPVLDDLIKHISGIVKSFENLSPGTKKIIGDFLLFTAIMAPMLILVGNVIKSVGLLGDAFVFLGSKMGIVDALGARGAGLSKLGSIAGGATSAVRGAAVGGAVSGGEALAGGAAAEGGAAAGLVGIGAAAAPIALVVAGVAALGAGIVILNKHINDAQKASESHATALQKEGQQALTTGGAHREAQNNIVAHTKAVVINAGATNDLRAYQMTAKQSTKDLAGAHSAVSDALKKYGPQSQQFRDAIDHEGTAILNNSKAQDALNKAMQNSKIAGKELRDSTANLNAAHVVLNQNLPKSAELHGKLQGAQNNQRDAAQKVKDAQKDLNTAVTLFGTGAPQTIDAAKRLKDAHRDLADKTQSVHYWQDQVRKQLAQAEREYVNYGGQLDKIHGKITSTTSALNAMNRELANAKPSGGLTGFLHNLHIPGFASGVTNFGGGLAMVGEGGPELVNLPAGSSVIPNNRVGQILNNSRTQTVTIGAVNLGDASAVTEFFKHLDRDNILVSKGLTPARGT